MNRSVRYRKWTEVVDLDNPLTYGMTLFMNLDGKLLSEMRLDDLTGQISLSLFIVIFMIASLLMWQRKSERVKLCTLNGRILLPSPRRLLPDWFGQFSGHMLMLEKEMVRTQGCTYDLRSSLTYSLAQRKL